MRGFFFILFSASLAAQAEPIRVAATAAGAGSGADWANAMALEDAWAALDDGQELWLKAETHSLTGALTTAKHVTLRGGFAGTETAASDRAAGAVTVFSGGGTVPTDATALLKFTATSGTVTLDALEVRQSYVRGVEIAGGAAPVLSGCRLIGNGYRYMTSSAHAITGRGAYLAGKAGVVATITNCYIALNQLRANDAYFNDSGAGAYVTTFDRLDLADTLFASNGIPYGSTHGRDQNKAGALYVAAAPVNAARCTFYANGNICRGGGDGGIVNVTGASDGSVFRNCLWLANFHHYWSASSHGTAGGALVLNMTGSCTLENCTLAYNFLRGACSPGVTVIAGSLLAHDTIFWGNLWTCTAGSAGAADVYVRASGSARLDACLLGGTDTLYLNAAAGSALPVLTGNTLVGDPLYATPSADFLATITGTTPTLPFTADTDSKPCKATAPSFVYDAHLRSTAGRWANGAWVTDAAMSPAIDAARKALAVGAETAPNGARRNLGAYGGTAEASRSLSGTPSVSATLAVATTEPVLSATLGGTGDYKATVWFCHGETAGSENATNGWQHVNEVADAAANGDELSAKARWQYAPGATMHWRVVVNAGGVLANAGGAATISADAKYPAWWTAGGGAGVLHVWPQATENGSAETGESWRNAFPTYDAALAAVDADHREIWIAGDPALSDATAPDVSVALTVRGGFTGAESAAAARPDGTRSVLAARNVRHDILRLLHASGTAVVERVNFLQARRHGLYKSGAGSIEIRSCRFEGNGSETTGMELPGRGAYLSGGTAATLLVSNCVFNAQRINMGDCGQYPDTPYQSGCGAFVLTFKRFDLVDTLFSSNGCYRTTQSGRGGTHGYALEIADAPTHALRCDFRANVGSQWGGCGSISCLRGASGGSSFTNCLWAGNCHNSYGNNHNGSRGGAHEVYLSSATDTCTFGNCTIAYNLTDGNITAAGLQVTKGTVELADSILWGNAIDTNYNSAGCDAHVSDASSSLTIRRSAIAAESTIYHAAAADGGIVYGAGNVLGDPLFATPVETFNADIEGGGAYPAAKTTAIFKSTAGYGLYDLHLRSAQGRWNGLAFVKDDVTSTAIDKAGEDLSYADEPTPNGDRRNLGRYGGTAEASMTVSGGQPAVTALTVSEAYDATQPALTVTLGGEGPYSATVSCCFGTTAGSSAGTEGWETVRVREAVGHGETITVPAQTYYRQDDRVYWQVVVEVKGAKTVVTNGDYLVTAATPVFYGHGGGESVVHVRIGAGGEGTGANWADAVTTLADAMALVTATRSEIWVGGDVLRAAEPAAVSIPTVSSATSVTLRGGFTGAEDAAAERSAGAVTTIDGATLYTCLPVVVPSGKTLTIRDIIFRRADKSALVKTGDGTLHVEGCRFTDNAWHNTNTGDGATSSGLFYGGGVSATSGINTFTNCLFDGNCERKAATVWGVDGAGIYGKSAALEVVDCAFLTNGLTAAISGEGSAPCREGSKGAAIYVYWPTSLKVVGSRFVGNRTTAHHGGSVIRIEDCYDGRNPTFVVSNCVFAANQAQNYAADSAYCAAGCIHASWTYGTDEVRPYTLDVANCTFAYNVNSSGYSAAGLVACGTRANSPITVNVRNCIFAGNLGCTWGSGKGMCDIRVEGYTAFSMDYTLIASTNAPHCAFNGSKTLTLGEHLVFADDARFVTATNEFLAALSSDVGATYPTAPKRVALKAGVDVTQWNLHLRGGCGYDDEATGRRMRYRGLSPAIDAGDPASDFSREPHPNGRRINLGGYGGTPWATRTGNRAFMLHLR